MCVKRHGGTLDKAQQCAKHDSRLSWNVAGATGATGREADVALPRYCLHARDSPSPRKERRVLLGASNATGD